MADSPDDAALLQRWRLLASAFSARGQTAEAGAALRRVQALQPNDPSSRFQLALDAERRAEAALAMVYYGRGLAADFGSVEALIRLAVLRLAVDRRESALALLLHARSIAGQSAKVEGELARVGIALGRLELARGAGRRHLALEPTALLAHAGLGQTAFAAMEPGAAISALRRAAMLAPDNAEVQFLAGNNLYLLRQNELGLACMQRAVDLDFENPRFHEYVYYFHMLNQADWRARADYTARVSELMRRTIAEDSNRFLVNPVLFLFLAVDSELLYRVARHFARHSFPPAPAPPSPPRRRGPSRSRIRLGYFSNKLWDHHIGIAQLPLIAAHDTDAFEIYLYSSRSDDAVQEQLAQSATAFRRLDGVDPDAFRKAIERDAPDVLIDLDGYLSGPDGRLSLTVMSRRVAPVQMLHHCYVGPTGTDFVDYVIGDSVLFAPEIDAFYSEKLVRLPPSYYPAPPLPISAPEADRGKWGLPEHGFVFANFGGFYKIEPTAFASWMRILASLPDAVLWLNYYDPVGARNLKRAAAAAGVAPERLVFTPPPPDKADHLARLGLADLFLDTFVYTSGVTSLDALWAGLPVLTLVGRTLPARVGASLNAGIGMEELSASTEAAFEAMAIKLARSPTEMARLKDRLRLNRVTHPLFDSAELARNLERAYGEAWRIHCSGGTPRPITIAAG